MSERLLSVRARKKVKAEFDKAERLRLMALFQKRMELARAGALYFKAGKYKEATQNYFQYIDVLERTKKVNQGGLEPKHFDEKKDVAEMLLLSGVFWDLAKLHDLASKKQTAKLSFYLDRFVVFSKGMPYQRVSSELVRKYLVNAMPKHRKEFKDAHVKLGGGSCFVVTAVSEFCEPETLPTLRDFRDERLLPHFWGQILVHVYYAIGPKLAQLVIKTPKSFRMKLASQFNSIARQVSRAKG